MSAAPVRKSPWWSWPILLALVAGGGWWIYRHPWALWIVLAAVLLCLVPTRLEARRRRKLATGRKGETICDFARSFDRQTDTWVIRAVFEEFSRFLAIDGRPFPVRRSDRWRQDLKMDADDLDDVLRDVAFRARRSVEDSEKNPLYGKVHTVGDIVAFLENQLRLPESEPDQPASPPGAGRPGGCGRPVSFMES